MCLQTIQNDYVDSDLTDFPLYVKISSDADIGAHAQSDGDDIRFTLADGVTVIPHETESFSIDSGNATGHFWVKVPKINSSSTTDIYIYYGNSEASNGDDPNNVWDDNFELVHHFGEDAWDGTSGEIKDSTSNGYDGVRVGDATTTSSGKIGRAGTFDGSGDYASSGDATISNYFTISFWALNNNTLEEEDGSWYGYPVYKTSGDFYMGWQGWTDGWSVSFQDSNDTRRYADSYDKYVTASTWYHIVGVYYGSHLTIYRDSTSIRDLAVGSFGIIDDGSNLYTGYSWDGLVDEVRISSTNRSADWIKFEYRNIAEADNELTISSEEEAPEVSEPSVGNPYMFTGRRYDLETGLYYYRARYYNPYIGRFLQTDPIGYSDGINWHSYCGNNPLNYIDPSGLIRIAFYDSSDEGSKKGADGDTFKEMCDDDWFDRAYDISQCPDDMTVFEYILDIIINKDVCEPITDIYFFDHGKKSDIGDGIEVVEIQLGDEEYTMYSNKFGQFLEDLGYAIKEHNEELNFTPTEETEPWIHFNNCYVGNLDSNNQRSFLKYLAQKIGYNVLAGQGEAETLWATNVVERKGPDYWYPEGVYMSTPDGEVSTVWVPEYNDWGSITNWDIRPY